jgi:hypothetical protein
MAEHLAGEERRSLGDPAAGRVHRQVPVVADLRVEGRLQRQVRRRHRHLRAQPLQFTVRQQAAETYDEHSLGPAANCFQLRRCLRTQRKATLTAPGTLYALLGVSFMSRTAHLAGGAFFIGALLRRALLQVQPPLPELHSDMQAPHQHHQPPAGCLPTCLASLLTACTHATTEHLPFWP